MKVLVTSADWKSALTVMRSLARQGHEISLVSSDPYNCHLYSKYCSHKVISPPEESKEEYVAFMLDHIRTHSYDLLIPISDLSNEYLSEIREEVNAHVKMFLPSKAHLALARNKEKTYRFCQGHGIRIPQTYFPKTLLGVEVISKNISYPCVVKERKGTSSKGNTYIHCADDLVRHFQNLKEGSFPMIQKFVAGTFMGLTAVCKAGDILNSFMFIPVRQYPSSGGVTVEAVSVKNETILKSSVRLFQKIGWTGAIDLDFFLLENGRCVLLEINPRFSGTIQFAYNCGVDLPRAYVQMVCGDKQIESQDYVEGKRYRSLFTEEFRSCVENRKYVKDFFLNFLDPKYTYDGSLKDPVLLYWQLKKVRWDIKMDLRRKKQAQQGSAA